MKNILICNQKGGVGKSLIADEIAYSFERSGIPVAFLDLDQQGGTIHEMNQREDAQVVVIDTPGALQSDLKAWMQDADIIVIPTRPTSRDIPPLLRMQEIQQQAAPDKKVVYVINGWNRWTAASDFKEWFSERQKSDDMILTLPQSEQYVRAGADNMSVVRYAPRSSAAKATLDMVNRIRRLAGFDEE